MGRPRNPISSLIKIERNIKTGLYEVMEDGIKYCMPMEFTVTLRDGIKKGQSIKEWYTKLSRTERKSIEVVGELNLGDTETYYDISE